MDKNLLGIESRALHDLFTASCTGCGYTLDGLESTNCPECGRAFDPLDPTTFEHPGKLSSWRKRAAPPALFHFIAALIIPTMYAIWSSVPGGVLASLGLVTFLADLATVSLLLWMFYDYVYRVFATLKDRARADNDRFQTANKNKLRWLATPLCFLILASIFVTRWPLHLRFELSRQALEQTVRKVAEGTDPNTLTGRVGYFNVIRITPYGNCGIYIQTGKSGFDNVGLDYCCGDIGCNRSQTQIDSSWGIDDY